jgi:excisionase family DNA binding protein
VELRATSGEGVERLAYSPAEVATAFGLSRKAIYRAIAAGELRAARVCSGSRLMVPVEEAQAWVERNLVEDEPLKRPPRVPVAFGGAGGRPLRAALAEFEASGRDAA